MRRGQSKARKSLGNYSKGVTLGNRGVCTMKITNQILMREVSLHHVVELYI